MSRYGFYGEIGTSLFSVHPFDRGRGESRRERNLGHAVAQRQLQYADKVSNGWDYNEHPMVDTLLPQKVTLIGRWGSSSGEFPVGLIGRQVECVGDDVHVWFKNRGVFKFPTSAIKRETTLGHAPPTSPPAKRAAVRKRRPLW